MWLVFVGSVFMYSFTPACFVYFNTILPFKNKRKKKRMEPDFQKAEFILKTLCIAPIKIDLIN